MSKEETIKTKVEKLLKEGENSPQPLVEILDLMIERNKKGKDNRELIYTFFLYLEENKMLEQKPLDYVPPKYSLPSFVANYINLTIMSQNDSIEEKNKTYENLKEFVKGYEKAEHSPLEDTTVEKLLGLYKEYDPELKVAYNYSGSPLKIFSVKYANDIYNSAYHPSSNIILINNINPDRREYLGDQEYLLLHEIGHALYQKGKEEPLKIIDKFKEIALAMFPQYSGKEGELKELFSDCFATVLMKGTEFEDKNKLCDILSDNNLQFLDRYFKKVLSQIDKGVPATPNFYEMFRQGVEVSYIN